MKAGFARHVLLAFYATRSAIYVIRNSKINALYEINPTFHAVHVRLPFA